MQQKRLELDIETINQGLQGLNSRGMQLTDLFMSGIQWLSILAEREAKIRFSKWAKLIRTARADFREGSRDKLIWLWKAITTEPTLQEALSHRLISFEEEWRQVPPVECLPAGSRFGIFFKNFRSHGYPVIPMFKDLKPDAEAETVESLRMKPGKARRLECREVPAILEIQAGDLASKEAEASALKADPDSVEIVDGLLKVRVKSLNHAYTTASLRLEPNRRSHGGRVYDHVGLKQEDGSFLPLESIRMMHEKRLWENLVEKKSLD